MNKHYPEEWTDANGNMRLTCVCGHPDPGHSETAKLIDAAEKLLQDVECYCCDIGVSTSAPCYRCVLADAVTNAKSVKQNKQLQPNLIFRNINKGDKHMNEQIDRTALLLARLCAHGEVSFKATAHGYAVTVSRPSGALWSMTRATGLEAMAALLHVIREHDERLASCKTRSRQLVASHEC